MNQLPFCERGLVVLEDSGVELAGTARFAVALRQVTEYLRARVLHTGPSCFRIVQQPLLFRSHRITEQR